MIYLFRATKIGYFASIVAGIIGCVFLLHALPSFVRLLIFTLWSIIVFAVFYRIAQHMHLKVYQLLYDCNVEGYLEIYKKFLNMSVDKRMKASLRVNLATGYLTSGDNNAAAEALSQVNVFPRGRGGALYRLYYQNNLFIYYLRVNDLPAATETIAQIKQCLHDSKLRGVERSQYEPLYLRQQCLLRMANGDYTDSEQIFDQAYQSAESTLEKVVATYTLGKIYLHEGRTDEASETFSYAARHGGSTFYQRQAAAYLTTGELPTPAPPDVPPPVQVVEHPAATAMEETTPHGFFQMRPQERKRYHRVIFILFAVLFIFYGGIGVMGHLEFGEFGPFSSLELNALFWGLFGGWGFTSLVGGIWLGSRFVRRQSRRFIICAFLLSMFTILIFWMVGLAVTIPFAIYNMVLLRRQKNRS